MNEKDMNEKTPLKRLTAPFHVCVLRRMEGSHVFSTSNLTTSVSRAPSSQRLPVLAFATSLRSVFGGNIIVAE